MCVAVLASLRHPKGEGKGPMREMQASLESGGEMLPDLAGSVDGLPTVDAELLFTGEFTRVGHDLQLTGADGARLTIEAYFTENGRAWGRESGHEYGDSLWMEKVKK